MTTTWTGVRDRIAALRAHPGKAGIFGADGHAFDLALALSPGELDELEAWLGVTLPDEYRSFLVEVGAGGAGPGYGVFPVVRNQDSGWAWQGDGADMTDRERLAEPFPVVRTLNDRIGELGESPDDEDFEDEAAFDEAMEAWHDRLYGLLDDPTLTMGAVCISHFGCAYRDWLVVSGPARGTMWSDPRCDDADLAPVLDDDRPQTFRGWYLEWLGEAEAKLGVEAKLEIGP
ncbi:SMI1/KNR4 family protein [Hamadaea tsunoensis]|uniref:SMI1/KNR4 family protein n=1 Tax=Hamadaea tsunoensis TaxID=53368 RepID=UPI00040D7801|nr:SMI1/KNR4 family protein [Hamadaea tsunoensis]